MKKKLFVIVLSVITALCALSFMACGLEFKINFIVDNEIYATVSTSGAETIKMPKNPEKDNDEFEGWFWDNGTWEKPFTANSLLDTPLSSDMNVYAKFFSDGSNGKSVLFKTLHVTENEVFGKVSNTTMTFNFLNEIRTKGKAKYTVSFDRNGNEIIASKNVDLNIGDNVYYINVTIDGEVVDFYTVTIRRRPIYTVTFNSNVGKIDEQKIEEDSCAIEPTTTDKIACTFIKWEYDFTKTITKDMVIMANYEIATEMQIFDFVSTETTCEIRRLKDNNIKDILIPDYVTSISFGAFSGFHNLESVIIGNGIKDIVGCFMGCINLKDVTISDSVQMIEEQAFYNCNNLIHINIPNSVIRIGDATFYGCSNLREITIPDSVVSIGTAAFYNAPCEKNSNGVKYVGKWLTGCDTSLRSVNIKSDTVGIADYAFRNCSDLRSLTIPDSVKIVGAHAFEGCNFIKRTNSESYVDKWLIKIELYVDSIAIKDGTVGIANEAFRNSESNNATIPNNFLTTITIPNSVKNIGDMAFSGCYKLTNINVAQDNPNYKSIDGNLYNKDETILIKYAIGKTDTEFTIPDSVTSIERNAFQYCSNLTSITIPNSVTSIERSTFYDCNSLTSITIPDSVTIIGKYAFYKCSSLTSVNYNGTTKQWNDISKGDNWKYSVSSECVVHCIDGNIAI